MRTRKWILVLAGVIALLGTGVYYSWNLFRANERIKEALLVKLRSTLDENSLIEKLEVGLGVVHLKGVNLDLPDSFYSLWIEDLRVGWSLGSWIKNGFKLSMTTDDILLIRPRLTVKYLSREQRTSPISEFSLSPWSQDKLKQFDFIKRITVSKGQIVFVDSTGQEILLASDINGWVNSVDFSNAICRMTGKLFASRQNNVFLEGQLNLSEGYLQHLEVELRDYQLSNQIPYLIPPYFDIQHGILNGNMTLSEKTAGSKGFDLAGGIRISSGRLKILNYDLVLDDLNLEAKIQDWDLVILKAHQIVNGSPVEMTGRIKNLLAPQFDLSFSSQEFDIRGFLEKLQPGFPLKLKGTSSLYLILKDSYANPSFEGWIESTRLLLNDLKLRYPRLDFVFQDSVFRVRKLQAQLGDTKVIGQGLVDFSTSNHAINFKFFCKGNGIGLLRAADLNGLKGCPWQLNLDFIGDTGQARGNGEFLCQLQPLVGDSLTIRGTLSYNQDQIQLTGHAPTHFSFSGKISNLFRQPTFNLRVKNFEELWYTCMALPGNKNLMGLNFGLQGQLQHWNFYTEALWKDQGKLISLMGEVWQQDNQKDIKGQMVFWPDKRNRLAGKFELRQTPGILYVRSFRLADLFTASGQMQLNGERRMEGRLEVSGARLSTLLGLFYPDNDLSSYLGNLSGRVDVTSTFFDPRMTGYLTLRDGFFNEVGSYDSELSFSLENGLFSLKEWQVNKNRALLFNSYGWYNFRTQEVNFELLGQNFDANLFVQTCTGKSDVVQGTASVELRVSDQVKTPQIDGELTIRNGTLFGFKFDDMSLVLGEHTTENLAMRGGDVNSQISAIQISDFSLIRERDFSIRGRGEIPYDSDEEMNIRLEAEGNLLSLLPELDSFFKATRSQGRLELILRGRPDSPRMEQGAYEFSDGYLRLGGVVEEIKNIKGKIRLNSEDGFVAIEQLSGTIRGEEFSITNVKEPVVAGAHQLEPFLLEELGLSLGIGILETSPKGIPVNIPGLMEKGELGWLEAVGKTEGEKFYLAGPWEHPTVRGCLRLRGLDFTFPFLPGSQSSSSTVINVLRSIHWDVRAVPTRDTRYVRNIRQGLDNVYVNLLINDGGEGLDFTGMLDDESFRIEGSLESTRGTVEYLDFNFRVERAGVEFDKTTLRPLIYGRAQTTVVDSTNYPFDVWLTLYTVDDETGEKLERGRWGKKLYFELSTENATLGFTDGQILAGLGYSAKNIREKAPDLIAISAENFFLKPLYRPFERQLERILGLDFVQLSSRFYRNLLEYNGNENGQTNSKLALLRSTRVTLGKYLADRLFFLYTGQVETNRTFQYYPERIGLKHTLGLEYRIKPNLLVEMEWDYDSLHLTDKEDKKIMLRHSFPF